MTTYINSFNDTTQTEIPRGVALGNFDGIHIGHGQLISVLISECKKRNLKSCVYTFENHPNNVLFKEKHTPIIMTNEQKAKIIEEAGADELFLEQFDENYAATSPETFIQTILIKKLRAKLVVVGYDYTFGKYGKGNTQLLLEKGKEYGFDVIIIPQIKSILQDNQKEVTVSSTVLRELIKNGNMADYKILTKRNYSIPGTVEQGRKVGKKLGFPTANILPKDGFALPKFGVYATITHTKDKTYRSITNIGNNPTFEGIKTITVETYLIGFEGELYGQDIEVEFIKKMRDEITFKSKEDLVAQISSDLKERKSMTEGIQKIYERKGLDIFYVPTDMFKTSIIKIMICDNLSKENAYKNGLIPEILCAATQKYPSKKALTLKMAELYGANVFGSISSTAETQFCEFRAEYADKKFLIDADKLEDDIIELLFEIIFNPLTEDYNGKKGFSNEIFNRERENRNVEIKSIINNKPAYATMRFKEIMFEKEPYSVRSAGKETDGDNLDPVSLFEYYKNVFLHNFNIKIIYSGREFPQKLAEYAKKYFMGTNPKALNEAYVERQLIKPSDVKYYDEIQPVNQGILLLGYRTNVHPLSDEYYASILCSAVLGQGATSKMFVNIREKNSLAYDAGAYCNRAKGVIIASCGIDSNKKDQVINLINEQIEAIRKGDISKSELEMSKKLICDDLRSYIDNQEQMMSYYFNQHLMGKITDTLEYIEQIKAVKKEDVINAANKMQLDTVYFLKGEENSCEEV